MFVHDFVHVARRPDDVAIPKEKAQMIAEAEQQNGSTDRAVRFGSPCLLVAAGRQQRYDQKIQRVGVARGFRFASLPWIGGRLEAMLPRFFSEGFGFNFYFGGTSLLIVVGVAMDTVQQVESKLVEHHYTGFLKKSRIRGRRT